MIETPFLPEKYHVLIIEDNQYFRHLLQNSLTRTGYQVSSIEDGRSLQEQMEKQPVNMILVDLMLPYVNGKELIRQVREDSTLPIMVITSLSHPDDLVECLSLGADEYITKPFSFNVMLARVEALLRRQEWNEEEKAVLSGNELIHLDEQKSEVIIQGRHERLTPQEYRFLSYMFGKADLVVSSKTLMQEVWHTDCLSNTLISSMVRRIRHKIEADPSEPKFLLTIWGRGYKLRLDQD
ncbi:MAG: response regulator transcription factor [Chloroflexota bacterium]